MTDPFIPLGDAANAVVAKLKSTVSRENAFLLLIEFDVAINALERLGALVAAAGALVLAYEGPGYSPQQRFQDNQKIAAAYKKWAKAIA